MQNKPCLCWSLQFSSGDAHFSIISLFLAFPVVIVRDKMEGGDITFSRQLELGSDMAGEEKEGQK